MMRSPAQSGPPPAPLPPVGRDPATPLPPPMGTPLAPELVPPAALPPVPPSPPPTPPPPPPALHPLARATSPNVEAKKRAAPRAAKWRTITPIYSTEGVVSLTGGHEALLAKVPPGRTWPAARLVKMGRAHGRARAGGC